MQLVDVSFACVLRELLVQILLVCYYFVLGCRVVFKAILKLLLFRYVLNANWALLKLFI